MENITLLYQSFNRRVGLGVMLSYIIVDALYARYTLEVVSLNPVASASIGAGMHFLLALGVVSYTDNRLYIFPIVIGSWIGTYIIVKREKHKKEDSQQK